MTKKRSARSRAVEPEPDPEPEKTALVYAIWLEPQQGYHLVRLRLPQSAIVAAIVDDDGELLDGVKRWDPNLCSIAIAQMIVDIEKQQRRGGV